MPFPRPCRRTFVDAGFYHRLNQATAGMSLREIARLTGINAETVRRQMKAMSAPSLELVARICGATGVSADWLLDGRPRRR